MLKGAKIQKISKTETKNSYRQGIPLDVDLGTSNVWLEGTSLKTFQ